MDTVVSPNSELPAGPASASDIIWGHNEMALSVQVTPGFVTLRMVNLRSTPAHRVHVVILPSLESVAVLPTVTAPFDIPPLAEVVEPVAYIAQGSGECSLIILHAGVDDETFMLREQVYLPASEAATLRTRKAWVPVLPNFARQELPAGDCAPAEGIAILAQLLQTQFFAIEAGPSRDAWWGAFNPVALVEAPVQGGLVLHMADGGALGDLAGDFAGRIGATGREFRRGVMVGRMLTTLQDYAELGWKAQDAVTLFASVKKNLQQAGIPLPGGWDRLISLLVTLSTLNELPPAGKAEYDRLLAEASRLIGDAADGSG